MFQKLYGWDISYRHVRCVHHQIHLQMTPEYSQTHVVAAVKTTEDPRLPCSLNKPGIGRNFGPFLEM